MGSKRITCKTCGRPTAGTSEMYDRGHWYEIYAPCYEKRLYKAATSLSELEMKYRFCLRKTKVKREQKPYYTNQITFNL